MTFAIAALCRIISETLSKTAAVESIESTCARLVFEGGHQCVLRAAEPEFGLALPGANVAVSVVWHDRSRFISRQPSIFAGVPEDVQHIGLGRIRSRSPVRCQSRRLPYRLLRIAENSLFSVAVSVMPVLRPELLFAPFGVSCFLLRGRLGLGLILRLGLGLLALHFVGDSPPCGRGSTAKTCSLRRALEGVDGVFLLPVEFFGIEVGHYATEYVF